MNPFGGGDPLGPLAGDGPFDPQALVRRQLFDRRIVTLSGRLDEEAANGAGVALMTLDASGDQPVHLQIDSGEGAIGAALSLMDIVDLLGVPVRATCVGQAAGPAVGVLAVCTHRRVSPHARLRLFEPTVELHGSARQLEQLAASHMDRWNVFCSRLSEVTGQPLDRLCQDAAEGRFFTAGEAVRYGLADEVATPEAGTYRLPGSSLGFGPR